MEIPALIEKARKGLLPIDHDRPAKLTDQIMMAYRRHFRRLPSDFYRWCRAGLYQHLCARFKEGGTGRERSRQGILDLWTDPIAREHVVRFGDSGFYDPNLRRYVDMTPECSIAQIRAGAAFKRKFASETEVQANAMEALADYLDSTKTKH